MSLAANSSNDVSIEIKRSMEDFPIILGKHDDTTLIYGISPAILASVKFFVYKNIKGRYVAHGKAKGEQA